MDGCKTDTHPSLKVPVVYLPMFHITAAMTENIDNLILEQRRSSQQSARRDLSMLHADLAIPHKRLDGLATRVER